jgi:hypothetical protein
MNDQLRRAMAAADVEELEVQAERIGREAVSAALVLETDRLLPIHVQDGAREEEARRREEEARVKAEAEAQRQRDQDAALADAIEAVTRHRARLGRKTCSVHDGATIRKIFELLPGLTPGSEE